MGSRSGGERCRTRWTARRSRLGLREVPQNRVHDVVVDDERDDLHLRTSRRAHQLVQLVDTLDEPGLTPAKGVGVREAILFVVRPCGANPAAPYKGGEQQHGVQYPGTAQGVGGVEISGYQ